MGLSKRLSISTLLLALMFEMGSTFICTKENMWGNTYSFNCPKPGQPDDFIFCCGSEKFRDCCSSSEIINMAAIIGIVVASIVAIVAIVLLICCCCSCCFLAKRRTRHGTVLMPTAVPTQTTTTIYIPPQQQYPTAPGYPPQDQQVMYMAQPPVAGFKYPNYPPSYAPGSEGQPGYSSQPYYEPGTNQPYTAPYPNANLPPYSS